VNQVSLTATAHEVKALRYTPAGLPVVEMLLDHASDVVEAGQPRHVAFQFSALALGEMALLLADAPLGAQLRLQGFLAAARKGSGKIVLHVQQAQRLFSGSVVV